MRVARALYGLQESPITPSLVSSLPSNAATPRHEVGARLPLPVHQRLDVPMLWGWPETFLVSCSPMQGCRLWKACLGKFTFLQLASFPLQWNTLFYFSLFYFPLHYFSVRPFPRFLIVTWSMLHEVERNLNGSCEPVW